MDIATAMAALPEDYAHALRLRDEGLDDAALAIALGRDEDVIGPLLVLAAAKLAALLAATDLLE